MPFFLDALSFFGSIASILSFNPYLLEKFKNKQSLATSDEILMFLEGVSETSKGWKTIHKEYYNIQRSISQLIGLTSVPNNGGRRVISVDDVSISDIKSCIKDNSFWDFVNSCDSRFGGYARRFKNSCDRSTELLKNMTPVDDKHTHYKISLDQYVNSSKQFLEFNFRFMAFTETIKKATGKWGRAEVSIVLDNFDIYASDYITHIQILDDILLAILDLLQIIVEEHKK